MITFFECWQQAATALFAQALAGEPRLEEALPKPMPDGAFGWAYRLEGDQQGRFAVLVDARALEMPLMGEGVDQKEAWSELLREVADAACGDLQARGGQSVRVASVEETAGEASSTQAFALRCGDKAFPLLVRDDCRQASPSTTRAAGRGEKSAVDAGRAREESSQGNGGRELLLDVELETTLRFGCRELPLAELFELGPGDVVQLDRQANDPVDLVVGDKIVARGEVVLVNGHFGLRITEVAEPKKRLETIRCIF